ncbi:hypothetical protein F0562_030143 [Nyssa sinensis]|uniref:Uncharacterized protein n=1 Tax=Nyssa sinensis TaxID=561372 RepID=A0A5J5AXT8_9ASTE|nr:hypothetical protein F0562_030143 [Nyssa sinensis]
MAIIGLGTVVMMPLIGNLSDVYGRKALLTLPLTLPLFHLVITNPSEQRTAALNQALEVAGSDMAKKRILEDLEGKDGDGKGKGGEIDDGVRVPIVRMKVGEVAEAAEATSVVVLPVCRVEREREVVEAPWECGSEGEFGVVVAEKGWKSFCNFRRNGYEGSVTGWPPLSICDLVSNSESTSEENATIKQWKGVLEMQLPCQEQVFSEGPSLIRSAEVSNVFLVNDFQDPLQRTLSSLELPRAVSLANGLSSSVLVTDSSSHGSQERTDGSTLDGCPSNIQQNGRQRQKFHDPSRDPSIQVLEKFSLVTKSARETTSQLFRESHGDGFGANQGRNHSQSSHDYPRNMASNDEQKVPDEIPVASDPPEQIPCTKLNHDEEAATNVGTFEVDKLTQVWRKPHQPPLGSDELR